MQRSIGARAAVLAGLLGGLWLLVDRRLASLLAWGERCFPVSRYPLLFASFFLTWLGVRAARGPAERRAALLVGSLACAAIMDAAFLAWSLAWIAVLHRVLVARSPRRVTFAWAFVVATMLALAVACNRDLWPDLIDDRPWLARWGYLFVAAYLFRVAWLIHQVRVRGPHDLRFLDVVTYLVFAPFSLIVPYMVAIPRSDRFFADLDRHDPAVERSGLRLIAWGIALTLAEAAFIRVYTPQHLAFESWQAGDYHLALLHGLVAYPPFAILHVCAIAAILVGLVRVLGFELGPSFDRPALARSVTEWWRRWNTHFRDLLVEMFYVPVAMRYRRAPVRGIVLGCASVFLVGSVLFHWPRLYFAHGHAAVLPVGIVVESLLMFAIVATALVRERTPGARRPGPIRGALVTWLVVFATVYVAGGGAQHLWSRSVVPGAMPALNDTPRSTHVFPSPPP